MAELTPWQRDRTLAIVESCRGQRGALLPILHHLQHEFGFVGDEAVPMPAQALNLSRAGTIVLFHRGAL